MTRRQGDRQLVLCCECLFAIWVEFAYSNHIASVSSVFGCTFKTNGSHAPSFSPLNRAKLGNPLWTTNFSIFLPPLFSLYPSRFPIAPLNFYLIPLHLLLRSGSPLGNPIPSVRFLHHGKAIVCRNPACHGTTTNDFDRNFRTCSYTLTHTQKLVYPAKHTQPGLIRTHRPEQLANVPLESKAIRVICRGDADFVTDREIVV